MRAFLTLKCCHSSPSIARQSKKQDKNFNANHLFCREIQEKDAKVKRNAKYANNSKVDSARPENLDKSKIETKISETHYSPVWLVALYWEHIGKVTSQIISQYHVSSTNYKLHVDSKFAKIQEWMDTIFLFQEAYSEPLRSIHQLHARVLLQSFCSFSGGVECPLKGLYFRQIYIFHPEKHTLSASGQYPKWPQQKSFSQQCNLHSSHT